MHEKLLKAMDGESARSLAHRAGVRPSTLGNMTSGKGQPLLNNAFRVAQALNVSLDWLADDSMQSPPDRGDSIRSALALLGKDHRDAILGLADKHDGLDAVAAAGMMLIARLANGQTMLWDLPTCLERIEDAGGEAENMMNSEVRDCLLSAMKLKHEREKQALVSGRNNRPASRPGLPGELGDAVDDADDGTAGSGAAG